MDDYTPEAAAFRARIRAFLAEHLPEGWAGMGAFTPEERTAFITEWRATLSANQLLAVAWPQEYGGAGLSLMERVVLAEEFATVGVPSGNDNDGFSIGMIGHTLIEWGTEEQKKEFLPKIINGEHVWCQGSSTAPLCGVRGTASRTPDRTWRRSPPGRCSTVTSG